VKSFGVLDLGHDAVAPELAYVTARYAALAPFSKVACKTACKTFQIPGVNSVQ
jgi:hypothetical protein